MTNYSLNFEFQYHGIDFRRKFALIHSDTNNPDQLPQLLEKKLYDKIVHSISDQFSYIEIENVEFHQDAKQHEYIEVYPGRFREIFADEVSNKLTIEINIPTNQNHQMLPLTNIIDNHVNSIQEFGDILAEQANNYHYSNPDNLFRNANHNNEFELIFTHNLPVISLDILTQ